MTTTPADDFGFLTDLIAQIDEDPLRDVDGTAVAEAIGMATDNIEATVRRLKNRALIDWAPGPPGPSRLGDGWTHRALAVTPEGYRFDGTGMTR